MSVTIEQMTAAKLAYEVLKTLDQQKEYFRTRDKQVLIVSKQMEAELRRKCIAAIAQAEPSV